VGCQSIGVSVSDNDVDVETDEISCEFRESVGSALRISILNGDVLSLNPAEVTQTLLECLVPNRGTGRSKR
jgi:hypothetical protein